MQAGVQHDIRGRADAQIFVDGQLELAAAADIVPAAEDQLRGADAELLERRIVERGVVIQLHLQSGAQPGFPAAAEHGEQDGMPLRVANALGVTGRQIYDRITEIGPVDLDMLNAVLRAERSAA